MKTDKPEPGLLRVRDYRFVPQPDITAYELAMLLNAIVDSSQTHESLLDHIKKDWPPDIFRHIQKANDSVADDFQVAVQEALTKMEQNHD
jgi:hypothetical protein